jgi:hypothetical protein
MLLKQLPGPAMVAGLVLFSLLGGGLSVSAAPVGLTVTAYADSIRFSIQQEDIKDLKIEIFSLAGEKLFDSGVVSRTTLDWKFANLKGRLVANGVYLYSVVAHDRSGNTIRKLGKLALLHGYGTTAPVITTTPSVGEIVRRTGPTSQFDGAGNLLMENDQICLGNACTAGGRIYDQVANNRTVFQGLGNKVSYVSEDGSKILMQLQTLTINGRDTALLAGGISGTKNIALLGDTGGNGDVLMAYAGLGKAGIGTSAPAAKLHVNNGTDQAALRIDSSAGTNALEIYNTAASASDPIYRVERATGNVYADGSFNCGLSSGSCFNAGTGADVAERIDAVEPMEPGDVVEIHPDQPAKFRKSQSAISTRVAGIISTAPAVTLGNNFDGSKEQWNGDTRPLLALAGRVPVKVMAKYGAIQVGDLLVSSPIPGYAMKCPKASECIGAVIGKALEPWSEGVGKIEVQVMLR